MSSKHLVTVLEGSVLLYKHQPQIEKIASYETTSNPLGLCCLGSRVLVFPGRSKGQLQIINLTSLKVAILPAHSSSLRAMTLSPDEDLVASASETVA